MAAILVVDDELEIRDLIERVLTREGHQVHAVVNGLDGLEAVRANRYDLVVCNVRMPVMDGPTFFTHVRDQQPAQATRFVFCTGDIVSPEVRSFLRSANQPVLAKPFSIANLRDVVRRLLSERPGVAYGLTCPTDEHYVATTGSV